MHAVYEGSFQNTLADGSEHQAEQPSLEILALANDVHINVGSAVRMAREVVGVAGCSSPHVGVCCREDDVVRIGPVVVQALPDAAGAFSYVGLVRPR